MCSTHGWDPPHRIHEPRLAKLLSVPAARFGILDVAASWLFLSRSEWFTLFGVPGWITGDHSMRAAPEEQP